MITYQKLWNKLLRQRKYPTTVKNNYLVVSVPGTNYHISVFTDQWNDYERSSGKPYHLFHISSNDEKNRCSSYFWVNKKNYRIQNIPLKFFTYNEPSYSFYSSTRSPCHLSDVKRLLQAFQELLNRISYKKN